MIVLKDEGLYCPEGDFFIDPLLPCKNAVITHAHADHARPGMKNYICTPETSEIMKLRISKDLLIKEVEYNNEIQINSVKITFIPAGHVLGSSQIKIDNGSEVTIITGDYKRAIDPTCKAFEVHECDTFVTEATFASPNFKWPCVDTEIDKIIDWHKDNQQKNINSVLFSYSLGKAQRIIKLIKDKYKINFYAHQSIRSINKIYMKYGIQDLETKTLNTKKSVIEGIIIAPPGARRSKQLKNFIPYSTGFCSGWTLNSKRDFDKGFTISDHADWNDLIKTIEQTKAKKVIIIHGNGPMLRKYLNEKGINVSNFTKNKHEDSTFQLSLFNG